MKTIAYMRVSKNTQDIKKPASSNLGIRPAGKVIYQSVYGAQQVVAIDRATLNHFITTRNILPQILV
jgi:hypothetical protein